MIRRHLVVGVLLFCASLWIIYSFELYNAVSLTYVQLDPLSFMSAPIFEKQSNLEAVKSLLCYEQPTSTNGLLEFDEKRDIVGSGKFIFFHETSCGSSEETEFDARQACSVESTAYSNPSAIIFLLFLSPYKLSKTAEALLSRLNEYPNVRVRRLRIQDYVRDTPMQDFYTSGKLSTTQWIRSHTSDFLRYLTLWKFGGIYIDLDFIVMTNLEQLNDFASAQSPQEINCAFIGLSKSDVGRKVINASLTYFKQNFNGNVWAANGPMVITNVLKNLCQTDETALMFPEKCEGFNVYPASSVYPINYENWKKYFTDEDASTTMELIKKANAIHLWNLLSHNEKVKCDSNVPYARVARQYCPKTFSTCTDTF